MSTIRIFTDDDKLVREMNVDDRWSPNAIAHRVAGIPGPLHGWIERTLRDARVMQAGGNPERPSERAMRLAEKARAESEAMEEAHAQGLHDDAPRDGCPECERGKNGGPR